MQRISLLFLGMNGSSVALVPPPVADKKQVLPELFAFLASCCASTSPSDNIDDTLLLELLDGCEPLVRSRISAYLYTLYEHIGSVTRQKELKEREKVDQQCALQHGKLVRDNLKTKISQDDNANERQE